MLDAALASGAAERPAVFEVFARGLPAGRRYGVAAGLGRLLPALEAFRFGPSELEWLASEKFLSARALEWLEAFSFSGTIDAYPEGECYFPHSPVMTVEASFGEAVLLETLVLSILNFDSAIASAASRMVDVAAGRRLVEMGSRRIHEGAAIAAARAAVLAGFSSTSNLEAGRRYGLPTAGTAAHAFTLVHDDEQAAFGVQLDALGLDTTLLVDTYDIPAGIEAAVAAARARGAKGPGAIRLDSGELVTLAREARALLDRLGATETRIVVSSDLDEEALANLAGAPVDVYGVGTRVVTGSGAPTAAFVYKLVAVGEAGQMCERDALRSVAKRSASKESAGGRKRAFRVLDGEGVAREELLVLGARATPEVPDGWSARALQRRYVESGVIAPTPDPARSVHVARERLEHAKSELPTGARTYAPGPPALFTRLVEG